MTGRKRVVQQKAKGPIDPRLGRRVRVLREKAGLSQAELAGDDFTPGFISLVETGRTRMSLRAVEIIATRLGVTLPELLNLESLALQPLEGLADLSGRLMQLSSRARGLELAWELRQLATEAKELTQRRVLDSAAVHARVDRALVPLRELAEATA